MVFSTTLAPFFMAANPIFPLYYNDIDRSTRDWTDEEFGCYMRLLMHQWAQGEIPKETQRLARIAPSVTQNWNLLKPKFTETETGMVNERLEEIREERKSFLKKQQSNGKLGGRKPKANPTDNPNTNPKQSLHNEYEHEEEKEEEVFKGGVGENEKTDSKVLTEMEIGQAYEYLFYLGRKDITKDDILNYWQAFITHKPDFNKESRGRQMQHFRDWLKFQKKQIVNDGTHKQPSSAGKPTTRSQQNSESLNYLLGSLNEDMQRIRDQAD